MPEIITATRYYADILSASSLVAGVVLMVSTASLAHSYLYRKFLSDEVLIKHMAFAGLVYFLVTVFGAPMLMLAIVNMIISYACFNKYYYTYQ